MSKLTKTLVIIGSVLVVLAAGAYFMIKSGVGADSTTVSKAKLLRSYPANNFYNIAPIRKKFNFVFSLNVKDKIKKDDITITSENDNYTQTKKIGIESISFPDSKTMKVYLDQDQDLESNTIYRIDLVPSNETVDPFSIRFMTAAANEESLPQTLDLRQQCDHIDFPSWTGKKSVILADSLGNKSLLFDGLSSHNDFKLYDYSVGTQAPSSDDAAKGSWYNARENLSYQYAPGVYKVYASVTNTKGTNSVRGTVLVPTTAHIKYRKADHKIKVENLKDIYGNVMNGATITVEVSSNGTGRKIYREKATKAGDLYIQIEEPIKSKSLEVSCYADTAAIDSENQLSTTIRSHELLIGRAIFDLDLSMD